MRLALLGAPATTVRRGGGLTGEATWLGDGLAVAVAVGDGEGDGDGEGEGEGEGRSVSEGSTLSVPVGDGDSLGEGDSVGGGLPGVCASTLSMVMMAGAAQAPTTRAVPPRNRRRSMPATVAPL